MGDAFKKILRGDRVKPTAALHNAGIDAAVAEANRRGATFGEESSKRQTGILPVRNESGTTLGQFYVLGLDDPAIGPSDNFDVFAAKVPLDGLTPNELDHFGKFCIVTRPMEPAVVGRAVVQGVVPVRLLLSDLEHKFADVRNGDSEKLKSCPIGGAHILWRETPASLPATVWAVVRISNPPKRLFKLTWCDDSTVVVYTETDLSQYLKLDENGNVVADKVLRLQDGLCYIPSLPPCEELKCRDAPCVTVIAEYEDCEQCRACWYLTDCLDSNNVIKTNTDLAAYLGQVVKLSDRKCYTVTQAPDCDGATPVLVYAHYANCTLCANCYTLENCWDYPDIVKTVTDLAALVSVKAGTPKTPAEVVAEGWVFRIGGVCYRATAYGECSASAVPVVVQEVLDNCDQCGCYKLIPCPSAGTGTPPIVAHTAFDEHGVPIDLGEYLDEVLRLDDGKCYAVERVDAEAEPDGCDGAVEITVLEAYDSCSGCLVYELTNCYGGGTIKTYSDLAGFEGKVVKRDDGTCWTVTSSSETWDAAAEEFILHGDTPETGYENCDDCQGDLIYRLAPYCAPEECEGGVVGDPIFTTTPLAHAVGKYVNVDGKCYLVMEVSSADTPPRDVSFTGPWDTCEQCLAASAAGYTGRVRRVTRVWWRETDDSLMSDVQEDIYQGGLLIGVCPLPTERVAICDCDDAPPEAACQDCDLGTGDLTADVSADENGCPCFAAPLNDLPLTWQAGVGTNGEAGWKYFDGAWCNGGDLELRFWCSNQDGKWHALLSCDTTTAHGSGVQTSCDPFSITLNLEGSPTGMGICCPFPFGAIKVTLTIT